MNHNKPLDVIANTADYWRSFYAAHNLRHDPSSFARWCLETQLTPENRILELGCGSGRDSFAFLQHGLPVLAVDGCEIAIADNAAYCFERQLQDKGVFVALNFLELDRLGVIAGAGLKEMNTLYTRFVLHAIPEVLEDAILDFAARTLPVGGRMMHEFRTIHDPLIKKGEVLSSNERLTDHYRRFIDATTFREKLARMGWRETYFIERPGLAKFGEDDPVVARVIAEKVR